MLNRLDDGISMVYTSQKWRLLELMRVSGVLGSMEAQQERRSRDKKTRR